MCCGSSPRSNSQVSSGSWYGSAQPAAQPDGPFEVTFPDRSTVEVDTYQEAESLTRQRGGGIRRKQTVT
jgi:hypothetical protein